MASIPTIMKGDTSGMIPVTVPEALAKLTVAVAGVTRTFLDVAANSTVLISYTAEETATMPLGTHPIAFAGLKSGGDVKTYPITAKLKVTDCPGDVYAAPVTIDGGEVVRTQPVGEVGEGATMDDIRTTVNRLARIASGAATLLVACVALGASQLRRIPGTNTVYTASETDAAIASAVTAAGSVTPQIATNIATSAASNVVTKSYVEALGINTSVPVNVVDGNLSYNGTTFYLNNNPFKPGYNYLTASDISASPGTVQSQLDLIPYLTSSKADQSDLNALSGTVSSWQTYWDGDDVRVTVTNYYGSAGMPRLYIEEKMPTNETHDSPWFKVVWDEMTRWTNFLSGYSAFTNNAVQNYADRAWGVYDSSTGAYSPDGLLQISQEQIQIASGLAYQKTITTGGCAVWVLKATEPQTVTCVSSNGFFRIEDGDGHALFEIVKGDKRTVGATASGIVAGNGMTITYNVVANEHPTLSLAKDLGGTWYGETECSSFATVSWSGSSGAYVATVTPVGAQPRMFAKASYVTGGDTYIRNTAPVSAAGGILCTDGVHKCRPVYSNGSITWEVVP